MGLLLGLKPVLLLLLLSSRQHRMAGVIHFIFR